AISSNVIEERNLKIRVAHILRSLEFGGAERLVVDLAGAQKESGRIEPELVCLESLGPLHGEAGRRGLSCSLIGSGGVRYLSGIGRMRSHFSRTKPDIVHTHNFLSHVHAAPAARLAGIPVVHTKHGRAVTSFAWSKRFRRFLYQLADRIVVVSNETGMSFLAKSGVAPERVVVIHNGIDTSRFVGLDRGGARRDLGIDGGAIVFGAVSRLDPVKDHPAMLEAFKKISDACARCVLVMVGDGPERGAIERMVKNLGLGGAVRIEGFSAEVPKYLASFDLFLQPSTEEGLSLTILEAAAACVPVVASSVGGTGEIIEDGLTGTLVPPRDTEALADAMRRFVGDPAPFREMARRAREDVEKRFSLAGMAGAYEALYTSVLCERGAC
ncbi:MAG: glycosyltransferase, partial [Candidatus Krumholzibacteria bacterium]|nr:glycosyltransferase [Candidatus Krumholzibacteria bacterium]